MKVDERGFEKWIRELTYDVIQGDYGYEGGEFSVYPDDWRSLWRKGLTPQEAFKRALDDFAEMRREEDAARQANWERIQREDAAALSRLAQAKDLPHG